MYALNYIVGSSCSHPSHLVHSDRDSLSLKKKTSNTANASLVGVFAFVSAAVVVE